MMFHGLKSLFHPSWRTKRPGTWTDWICPVLSVILAIATLRFLGFSYWTAAIAIVLLVCPVMLISSYIIGTRPLPVPLGPVPETRGRTLNWVAPYYDSLCRIVGLGHSFRERTLAVAALKPGEKVLDVGCGTGMLTRRAADIVGTTGSVIGIDPAPDMVRLAQQRPGSWGSRARFQLGAIEDLRFETGIFDVVLASLMLHHLPADVKWSGLREVYRVLRPGGRIVVVDFNNTALSSSLRETGFDPIVPKGRWHMLSFLVGFKPMRRLREI